jgi:hypothetical protein
VLPRPSTFWSGNATCLTLQPSIWTGVESSDNIQSPSGTRKCEVQMRPFPQIKFAAWEADASRKAGHFCGTDYCTRPKRWIRKLQTITDLQQRKIPTGQWATVVVSGLQRRTKDSPTDAGIFV